MDQIITNFVGVDFEYITEIGLSKTRRELSRLSPKYRFLDFDVSSVQGVAGVFVIVDYNKKVLLYDCAEDIGQVFIDIRDKGIVNSWNENGLNKIIERFLGVKTSPKIYLYVHKTKNRKDAENLLDRMDDAIKIREIEHTRTK